MSDATPGENDSQDGGLIGWFVRNPVAANLLMVVLLIGGLLSASTMRSQVFPTISPGIVTVTVPFPGATPAEVEEGITRRVEEAVLGIDGVDRVLSTASENVGVVTVETRDFADIDQVRDDVEAAVDQLQQFPPENAEQPVVVAPEPTGGVVTLVVLGDAGPLALRKAAEQIERDLLTQPGVSLVSLAGDRDYEISIEVSEDTLRRYGLSLSDVAGAVRRSSIDLAGGSIVTDGGEYLLRTNQRRLTGEAFETIDVVTLSDGSVIRIGDIATVRDAFSREDVLNTYNGRPAIFVEVSRAEAEDVLAVKAAVDTFLEGYVPPEGVEIVEFRDQTLLLEERVNLLLRNALFGFALVFLFLVLMLDLKLAFWVCVGIATAFLGGFMIFDALGVTLTMISLFGLIIVLGLVVDDAIVIGENIDAERASGVPGVRAAVLGVTGVFAPVLVGVGTTVAAFAPLLVTGGTFGEIARAIPLVVISVLIVSIIEAFLILPSHLSHGGTWSRGIVARIQGVVAGGIQWFCDNVVYGVATFAARWRYATFGVAIAFFLLCMGLLSSGTVRFIFFPNIEGNEISVSVTLPEGAPFSRTKDIVMRLEEAAYTVAARAKEERGEDLFLSVATTAGGRSTNGGGPGDLGGFTVAENVGQVQIELVPFGDRRTSALDIERAWRQEAGDIEGIERLVFTAAAANFGDDISFELAHEQESQLLAAVNALSAELADIRGVRQIDDTFDLGKRQLVFELTDAGRAAGLRPEDIARQVRQAYFGEEVQRIQRGREEVEVFVRYPREARESLDSLEQQRIRLADGSEVPLFTVARTVESRSFSSINRIDGRRVVTVTADVDEAVSTPNVANGLILEDIMPRLEEDFPGLRWRQGGATREQNEDFASLGRAFLIALMIIYAMVATQLRSYLQPLAIMMSIPLGLAGAILGHLVLGYPLSFVSIFGVVALAGVAVNASVVLVDRYNQHRRDGIDPIEAAGLASRRRFRPIFLTTLTTALGLGPLLLETSPQAQFLIPMGVSLGFGIVISSFLVLSVTPALAVIIEDLRKLGIDGRASEKARREAERASASEGDE